MSGWSLKNLAMRFHADHRGQTSVEWALIVTFIGLPMFWIFKIAVSIMVEYYHMLMFLESLPFP